MFLLESVVVVALFAGFVFAVSVAVAAPESSVSEMSLHSHAAVVVLQELVGPPYVVLLPPLL